MLITKLEEISKAKSRVFIDEEFAFALYKGELRAYHIKTDEEISEETYWKITKEVLPKRAKLRCMNLLKSRNYTEKELHDKLRSGGYEESIISEAVEYVKSFGYVNDENYAENYMTYHLQSKSERQVEMELQKRGISKEIIKKIIESKEPEELENTQIQLIKKQIEKKHFHVDTATREETNKFFSHLFRKGFSIDLIKKTVTLYERKD